MITVSSFNKLMSFREITLSYVDEATVVGWG